uniref:Calcitonin-Dr1 n=1 Tax=Desmodus rotundus TaxID=9430 RepID=M0QRP3_DESRO
MGFGKSSPFLAFSLLVLCQAGGLQATPLRSSALESRRDTTALAENKCLLLAALLKAYIEGKFKGLEKEEQGEQETENSVNVEKRSCNTATCVTHRLAGLLSRSGGVVSSDFTPTDTGSNSYGRRRRDLQA